MLDHAVGLDAGQAIGISMFARETEGRVELVLRDAAARSLAPLDDFMKDLPDMEVTPVPFVLKQCISRTLD
jgi:hypothetical protein